MCKFCKLTLLLLLIYYLAVCLFCAHQPLQNDEYRYLWYAQNLSKGYYAPADTKLLWNGPGYPLFLSVFVVTKLPITAAKYCNAFFVFGAVIFVYRSLRFYTTELGALGCALLFGLYPPLLPEMPKLLTEPLSVFLAAGLVYFMTKAFRTQKIGATIAAGLFGAGLILTKAMFAYVAAAALVIAVLLSFWKREHLRAAVIYLCCLLFCLPYLVYTYRLSGKLFYWCNSGGSTLYWMSSPYPNELGDWRTERTPFEDERYASHRAFFETLQGKDYVEKDALFKKEAIKNIRKYPLSYAANWISNFGRMWMDYPFAYKYQRPHTLFYMFPNAILLTALIASNAFLLISIRRLPAEIMALGVFGLLFLAESSLVYSCVRYLVTIVPVLSILAFYCWTGLLQVSYRPQGTR